MTRRFSERHCERELVRAAFNEPDDPRFGALDGRTTAVYGQTVSLEEDRWAGEYSRVRPDYAEFASRLRALICELLGQAGIDVVQTESRAKDVDSFVRKLSAKEGKYRDPLRDMTDLCGVRIVAYYAEDLVDIGALIHREFSVDEDRSVHKADELATDRFGYVSDHYIVRLDRARGSLVEWQKYDDMVAELQVRTVSQHAWAAVEHGLGYKSAASLPRDLRRRLYRLSALFELADEQFSAVRREADLLARRYSATLQTGSLLIPLDATSLGTYVRESGRVQQIAMMFRTAGGTIRDGDSESHDPDRQELDRADLFEAATSREMQTLRDLDEFLERPEVDRHLIASYVRAHREAGSAAQDPPEIYPEDLLTRLLLIVAPAGTEEVTRLYSGPTAEAIIRAAAATTDGR